MADRDGAVDFVVSYFLQALSEERFDTFINVGGGVLTDGTVTVEIATGDDGAQFTVAVSNAAGSVVSQAATLTVSHLAPSITEHPANVAVDEVMRYAPRSMDVVNLRDNSFQTVAVSDLLEATEGEYPGLTRVFCRLEDGRLTRGGRRLARLPLDPRTGRLLLAASELDSLAEPVFKLQDDPRVTRVGRVLRRFSIDELPQLFNVLRGEMSLVGIRPLLAEELDLRSAYDQACYRALRPGMTGLWQISGRSELSYEKWIYLDLYYITHRCFMLDLIILFRTFPAVLTGRGAY